MRLRHYQKDAVDRAIHYLKMNPNKNPIICAATGTGKSLIIASLIERVTRANDARIMVCTHVAELLTQNAEKLAALLPLADMGFYSASIGSRNLSSRIIFAGIASVYRATILPHINILIVDEAHTISRKDSAMWSALIKKLRTINPNMRIIGLSATPFRMDSGSLTGGEGAIFHDVVFDYGLGRAVADGWLCPLVSKETKTVYDVSGVSKSGHEFNLKELEAATNKDGLNARAVLEMIERGQHRKAWLVFCNGVNHSFAIRDEFRKRGISCDTITGETPEMERAAILKAFKAGETRCLTNNAVLTTGIDMPGVDMIGMLRHTLSGGLLLQMAGRGTRVVADLSLCVTSADRKRAIAESEKPNCLFLDFAGNIRRHGFLDEIGPKDKNGGGDGVPPMKACPECFSICHAAARTCKDCGYEFQINKAEVLESAYSGSVISEPEYREIIDVEYLPHNMNRAGKTPCLRVRYHHPDRTNTSEYILLWHTGFALSKAIKWWNARAPADSPDAEIPNDPAALIDAGLCRDLLVPKAIKVKKEGKYDRIVSYVDLRKPDLYKAGAPIAPMRTEQNYWADEWFDDIKF